MPRPPKASKDRAPAAPQPVAPATVAPRHVEVEAFLKVRDSALARIKTLQQLVGNFADDYLRQTNLLLGVTTPLDEGSYSEPLAHLQASLDSLSGMPGAAAQPMLVPAEEQKKERKKRTHDPNAPKRPLTPYFLYMQTARPIIAADLGASAPKGAVQEEGQRRWATMGHQEKAGWNNAYQYNLRLYNARVHSYKNGNPAAKSMSDDEALAYAESNEIPIPPTSDETANEQAAIAEQLQGNSADAHGEVEEAPPTKGKKAAAGRKRKTQDAEELAAVPQTPASPAQKRRRSTKATAPDTQEEPKKSGRKKAAKA